MKDPSDDDHVDFDPYGGGSDMFATASVELVKVEKNSWVLPAQDSTDIYEKDSGNSGLCDNSRRSISKSG